MQRELQAPEAVLEEAGTSMDINAAMMLTDALQAINTELWDVEDALRQLEAEQRFDQVFIDLARSVYQLNDQRLPSSVKSMKPAGRRYLKRKATENKEPASRDKFLCNFVHHNKPSTIYF